MRPMLIRGKAGQSNGCARCCLYLSRWRERERDPLRVHGIALEGGYSFDPVKSCSARAALYPANPGLRDRWVGPVARAPRNHKPSTSTTARNKRSGQVAVCDWRALFDHQRRRGRGEQTGEIIDQQWRTSATSRWSSSRGSRCRRRTRRRTRSAGGGRPSARSSRTAAAASGWSPTSTSAPRSRRSVARYRSVVVVTNLI